MRLSALIICAVALFLMALFIWITGAERKTITYIVLVIAFLGFCVWALINWTPFTAMLEEHLGTWGMIGVLALISWLVWKAIHFFE